MRDKKMAALALFSHLRQPRLPRSREGMRSQRRDVLGPWQQFATSSVSRKQTIQYPQTTSTNEGIYLSFYNNAHKCCRVNYGRLIALDLKHR